MFSNVLNDSNIEQDGEPQSVADIDDFTHEGRDLLLKTLTNRGQVRHARLADKLVDAGFEAYIEGVEMHLSNCMKNFERTESSVRASVTLMTFIAFED